MALFSKLLLNFLLVGIISSAVAGCLYFFHLPFLPSFILTTIIQYIIGYFYGKNQEIQIRIKEEELKVQLEAEYAKQSFEVTCPCYLATKTTIPIRFDTDNSYNCGTCKKNVSVYIDVKTALPTIPVQGITAPTPPLEEKTEFITDLGFKVQE